jgi:DNA-binding NtrC family response regulator
VRILFVDDEELVRDLTAEILRQLGHELIVCSGGQEAVQWYRKEWQTIDLVILDMLMPDLNGREVFVALKEVNPQVKTLVSSGYSEEGEAQDLLREGVSGFLQKPFLLDELAEKIRQVMKR